MTVAAKRTEQDTLSYGDGRLLPEEREGTRFSPALCRPTFYGTLHPRLDPSVLRFPHLEFENTHVAGLLIRANKTRPGPDLCEAQGACKCWPCPLLCEEAGGRGAAGRSPRRAVTRSSALGKIPAPFVEFQHVKICHLGGKCVVSDCFQLI